MTQPLISRSIHLGLNSQSIRLYGEWSMDRIEALTGDPEGYGTDRMEVFVVMPDLPVAIAEIHRLQEALQEYALHKVIQIELTIYSDLEPERWRLQLYGNPLDERRLCLTIYLQEGIEAMRAQSLHPLAEVLKDMQIGGITGLHKLPDPEFDAEWFDTIKLHTLYAPGSGSDFNTLVVHEGRWGVIYSTPHRLKQPCTFVANQPS